MINRLVRLIPTVLVGAALLTLCSVSHAATGNQGTPKLYRWVDSQGNVTYGDKIPPEYAQQGNKELSSQGVVVKTTPPPKTPEQRAEEQRLAQLKAEQDRIAKEKSAHDRMLLNTFSSEDDLIMTRNGKLAAIDAMINATTSRNESLKKSLVTLRASAAERERNGQTIPIKLRDDIASMRSQIQNNISYIASKQQEQEQLRTQFEADLERFRELKTAQAKAMEQMGQVTPAAAAK